MALVVDAAGKKTAPSGGGGKGGGNLFEAIRNNNPIWNATRQPQSVFPGIPDISNIGGNQIDSGGQTFSGGMSYDQTSAYQPIQQSVSDVIRSNMPISPQSHVGGTGRRFLTSFSGTPMLVPDNEMPQKEDDTHDPDDEINAKYEEFFRNNGMSEDDIRDIEERGSWFDIHANPNDVATGYAVQDLGKNPFLDISMDDFVNGWNNDINTLVTEGNFTPPSNEPTYTNSNTKGGIHFIDDGETMDYDHLTADRATGTAMQKYGELGMGGRDWWEYDPYATYLKSDERQDAGFTPYLPDQTARANMFTSQALDAPSDLIGALAQSRELATDYKINYDSDGDKNTNDDVVSFSGSDFDYRALPYLNNMDKMLKYEPLTFLSMPEGGKVHGAPVSTLVLEHEMPDRDGSTRYVYGDLVDSGYDLLLTYDDGRTVSVPKSEYSKWKTDDAGHLVTSDEYSGNIVGQDVDDSLHLVFSDGQDVHVPQEVYNQWQRPDGSMYIPDPSYVSLEQARGFVPENLDALNEDARKNVGERGIENAPVLYLPDMVMDDGTRLTYEQAKRINHDQEAEDNPETTNDDNLSYDFGVANIAKPKRLTGDIVKEDASSIWDIPANLNWEDMLNNTYDFTMGSIPISISRIAWPLSVSQSLSKSLGGIDPGKYDSLTGSDRYISADQDETTGELKPSYNDVQLLANAVGNAIVPLTEEIAGPISGSSLIEKLSGDIPNNPTKKQVLQGFLTGMIGEGLEEIVGNFFDGITNQGDAAFGNPTTPEGERLLDDNGEPVRDENGNYKFVDVNGEPLTSWTDNVGHEYVDRNTPINERVRNFLNLNDLANAFFGGALVDTVMQLPSVAPDFARASRLDKIRRQTGTQQYVETERDRMRDEARRNGRKFDPTQGDVKLDPRFVELFGENVSE